MTDLRVTAYLSAVRRLNGPQREAFLEPGNTVLLAGPGSGKTATLVLKIARLLDAIPPPRGLACLTYGNEAAREFEARLRELGIRKGGRLFTGTVHAFCLAHVIRPFGRRLSGRLQEVSNYEVADRDDTARARQKALDAAGVNENEAWWSTKISAYRRVALVDPSRKTEFTDDRLPLIADEYKKALRAARRIDFDDIVLIALRLVETDEHVRRVLAAKYPWLVIDEYQDLGLALHCMVVTLMEEAGIHVFAVGDPDQSIYGFAGARPEFLNDLKEHPGMRPIRLELNYRCRQRIIDASLHVLQPEEQRGFRAADKESDKEEIIFHKCPGGLAQQAAETVERIEELLAADMAPGDIGILAARWQDLAEFEEQLEARGIPYRIAKTLGYTPTPLTMWIEDLAAWCAAELPRLRPRLAELFAVWDQLVVVCRGETRGGRDLRGHILLHQALQQLRDPKLAVGKWIGALDKALGLRDLVLDTTRVPLRMRHDVHELGVMMPMLAASEQPIEEFSGLARDKVVLQSIHGSKGLEYTVIFIPALESGVLPRYLDDRLEARRLFYVAITRARREVHLLWSGFWCTAKKEYRQNGPSPLLIELGKRLAQK